MKLLTVVLTVKGKKKKKGTNAGEQQQSPQIHI